MNELTCPNCKSYNSLVILDGDYDIGTGEICHETGYGCDRCGKVFSPSDVEPMEPERVACGEWCEGCVICRERWVA